MDGIIVVDKEAGFTSFDVVAKLRGILKIKKIGHTGTLDPDATGVLPVCIGKATKVCDVLTDRDKTYEAEVVLGVTTDTLDMSGEILTESAVDVSEEDVRTVLKEFTGDIIQVPPMYSAVKVNGKRLYEYARKGETVERRERHVRIDEIEPIWVDIPSFKIRVKCSKGTYIRTLCDDIGRRLSCGAAMGSLVRTAVGRFDISQAVKLSEVERLQESGEIENILIGIDEVFGEYPRVTAKGSAQRLLDNGNPLTTGQVVFSDGGKLQDGDVVRVYDEKGEFYAIYRYDLSNKKFKVLKFFH